MTDITHGVLPHTKEYLVKHFPGVPVEVVLNQIRESVV
jgi:hypothetical protein